MAIDIELKLVKVKYNLKFSFSITVATFEIISSHMGLMSLELGSTDLEYFRHCGQFCEWMALFQRNLQEKPVQNFKAL